MGSKTYYTGVTPGKGHPPPDGLPASAENCYLTWQGFQLTSKGSRIFVQFTNRPTREMNRTGRTIEITFPLCRIRKYNNRRRLVTRHFATPVKWVKVRRKRKNIILVLKLRADAKPTERWTSEGKFHFYFLEFGPYKLPAHLRPGRRKKRFARKKAPIESRGGYIRVRPESR